MREWITQLRKGLLDFCLLNVLAHGETYGYELVRELRSIQELAIGESTAYPILSRLRKDKFVKAREVPSESGPPRRYYSLTDLGQRRVHAMNEYWDDLAKAVERLRTKGEEEG